MSLILMHSMRVKAISVFTFSDNFYPIEPPSFASLTRNIVLPDAFILCSSSRQARFDDRVFYSVLGEKNEPWLSVYFENMLWGVFVWLKWNDGWYKFGRLNTPQLAFWYHICLEVNIQANKITCAMNGNLFGVVIGNNITNSPTNLHMIIGKGRNFYPFENQFQGSVTNIKVYASSTDHSITALSSDPCTAEGDLLAWRAEDWRVDGEQWLLVEETKDSVCDQGNMYVLAIPVEMGVDEAMDICGRKLNNSSMPYHEDLASLRDYTAWYYQITEGKCQSIWTPFSDENQEGVFRNSFVADMIEAKFLPWENAQPNGGVDENFVRILYPNGLYLDTSAAMPGVCSSCLLARSLLLRLDGLCEESYIGNQSQSSSDSQKLDISRPLV